MLAVLLALVAQANDPDFAQLAVRAVTGPVAPHVDIHELRPRTVTPWAGGTRVRLQQRLHGLPVLGSEIVVSFDPSGDLVRTAGEPLSDLYTSPQPSVFQADAHDTAAHAAVLFAGADRSTWQRSELVYWVDAHERTRLVWKVDVGLSPLATWTVLVDAHAGGVVSAKAASFDARANVYQSNPTNGELIEVELAGVTGAELDGPNAFVVSCTEWNSQDNRCTTKQQLAQPDGGGNFLFQADPTNTDDPLAEVQMYHHLDRVAQYFADVHGANLPAIEGIVNFRLDNAFFGDADGDGIAEVAFGQGNTIDFAYDADVIYHEYGHAAFGSVVSGGGFFDADEYGISFAAASLNEGTADAFALALTGDPKLGEYAGTGFGLSAIRELDQDLRCPDDLYGESHEDGEVWAAAAWRMMADDRIGTELAADVFWGALTSWPSEVDWEVAGDSIGEVADDMLVAGVIDQGQHEAILEVGDDTGLIGCTRVVALDLGAEPTQAMYHPGFVGEDLNVPLQNQFSLDTPEGTYRLRVGVTEFDSSTSALAWNLYVRRGEPVGHDLETVFGQFERPIPADFDYMIEGTGVMDIYFDLPAEDGAPAPEFEFVPGETYYFSIASRADGSIGGFAFADVTVDGEALVLEQPAGSCACDGGSRAAWWLAPVALLTLRRRRG